MKLRLTILAAILLAFAAYGSAGARHEDNVKASVMPAASDNEAARLEGERRFHANCGRCHAAPHKFPPRMMKTFVRHMRVRAMITDDDMKYILAYMTQ